MIYGTTTNGARVLASPNESATCPECSSPLIAKCGEIKSWHWSHRRSADCDPWSEGESKWHREWKMHFSPDQTEVVIRKGGSWHRADVLGVDGTVVEFQHSSISTKGIRERELFYDRMIWVFDARKAYDDDRLLIRDRDGYVTFRWKHARLAIAATTKPVYLDIGCGPLLLLKRIYAQAPVGGWCAEVHQAGLISTLRLAAA